MTYTLILLALVFAMLTLRQPLMLILIVIAAAVQIIWGKGQLDYIIEDMWISLDKELILSIPLFLLCGNVMTKGSTAKRLMGVMISMTRPIPGGMAIAAVLSCGVFAAISGSSIVTMLAIGTLMYPTMRAAGYENKFTLGTIMSAGTLGIIIPPSIPMIIYGLVTEASITDLFTAGIGPGILILIVLSIYAYIKNRKMPTQKFDFSEFKSALKNGIWAIMMPVIILGGIYSGYFSATEAAAIALIYAIIIEFFVHKSMVFGDLYDVVLDASKLGGSLFPVLAIALSINVVMVEYRLPTIMVEHMQQYISSPITFMLLVNLLLLIAGCLMTTGEAILILAPILAPLAMAYGYDKVLFGVIMILNLEIGFLTPPVGLNLLVAMSAFKQPFGLLIKAAFPFIILMLLCLVVVIWQPWIAMYLVNK